MTQAISLTATTQIHSLIASAAAKTGVDFDYLLATAQRESGLETQAKSKTSSASGLYQFIDQTWLSVVKQHGAEHGLGDYAGQIERSETGRFNVADPAAKEEILALRHDPKVASLMAGELTRDTASALQQKLGRAVSKGELYMAHFLGASGAARFISAAEANPNARAAEGFGREAAANRSIFFEKTGNMRSLRDVYDRLTSAHDQGTGSGIENKVPHEAAQPPMQPFTSYSRSAMPAQFSSSLGSLASKLTPQVLMILASLDLPFGED